VVGYEINWSATASERVLQHPLYQKYSSSSFDGITVSEVKQDLGNVLATTGSTAICAYLAWLIRIKNLLA